MYRRALTRAASGAGFVLTAWLGWATPALAQMELAVFQGIGRMLRDTHTEPLLREDAVHSFPTRSVDKGTVNEDDIAETGRSCRHATSWVRDCT